MGSAQSLFRLIETGRWDEVESFLLHEDISHETKVENISYRHKYKGSTIQLAIYQRLPINLIARMIDIVGDDLITKQNRDGFNLLHDAAIANSHNHVLMLLSRVGGRDLLMHQDNRGMLPIHYTVDKFGEPNIRMFKCLLHEGCLHKAGDMMYGLGGLFIRDSFGHSTFDFLVTRLNSWQKLVDLTEEIFSGQPLLHAAIYHKVSIGTIWNIIHYFPKSVTFRDSLRRLPLHVGIQSGMEWKHLEEVIEADENAVEEIDSKATGLYPFALAAAGGCESGSMNPDLNTIYHLLQRRIDLLFHH
mmetsp:Transcript_6676/g.7524  ORF Transcript_6676/g.7524 Transcript_6676/m.7524 type:complete len:302 (+) Transcript_6676:226-1131(+)